MGFSIGRGHHFRPTLIRLAATIPLCLVFDALVLAQPAPRHPARGRPSEERRIPPGAPAFARGHYAVFLEDPPVSARFATRDEIKSAAGVAYRQQIEARQAALKSELAARSITVTGSVSTLLNAVFVVTPASRLAEIQALTGVMGVREMRRGKRAMNRAVELVNAPAAWSVVGGQGSAGAGLKIGILDTGIDQTHPAFQDATLAPPAGFPICTSGHPEDCAYTNNKVIVARSYVRQIAAGSTPSNPAATSMPDDYSPRDRDGHGSAVASVAAANTNSGTVTFNGVAPKAFLGNYKVYGTDGVNDFPPEEIWIEAIEDALNDGMDVANFSSGLPALTGPLDTGAACGNASGVPCDPLATAFENAAHAGMVIAVSAGNDGSNGVAVYPTFNSIESPSDAPSVISAGASINSHVMQPAVSVLGLNVPSNLMRISAQMSDSFFFPSVLGANEAPLYDVTAVADDACSPLPANSLVNAYALIEAQPGTSSICNFGSQATNAQNAGAIGVIFYNNTTAAPGNPEGLSFTGPVVEIGNSDGLNLKSLIDAHPGQMVLIDTAGTEQNLSTYSSIYGFIPALVPNELASYSSFGPAAGGGVKPDMVATGGFDVNQFPDLTDPDLPAPYGMYTAAQSYDPNGELYSVNRYAAADGTSFASPMMAGAAALVKQAHPGLTGTQIKSALVNSAATMAVGTDTFGNVVDVEWMGAGLLNAGAAAGATVTSEPATVSFGYLTATSTLPISESLTITNKGSASVALTVSVAPNLAVAGVTVSASPASFALAAGAATTVKVTLSGTVPAPNEYSGYVNLHGANTSLSIPYMFLIGDGQISTANVAPLYGSFLESVPGGDAGPAIIQVIDDVGVPIAGAPVTFAVSPRGSVTLESVSGEPACSPSTSTAETTCMTDAYGNAYAEVIMGRSVGSPTITATAAGTPITLDALILNAPSITAAGVVNAANDQVSICAGSYASIYGQNLVDPEDLVNPNGDSGLLTSTGALPLQIDFTTVSFDVPSAGISVPGYMLFASPGLVNVWVPWELEGQSSVEVKVTFDEFMYGNVVTVPIALYCPAFFASSGTVVAQDQNYNLISTSNPAKRGQLAILYVDGLGPVSNQPASGDPALANPESTTTTQPVVMIGGQPATTAFSGLVAGFPGLYQVNVTVPTNVNPGNLQITIAIGAKTSPAATIPVQ